MPINHSHVVILSSSIKTKIGTGLTTYWTTFAVKWWPNWFFLLPLHETAHLKGPVWNESTNSFLSLQIAETINLFWILRQSFLWWGFEFDRCWPRQSLGDGIRRLIVFVVFVFNLFSFNFEKKKKKNCLSVYWSSLTGCCFCIIGFPCVINYYVITV